MSQPNYKLWNDLENEEDAFKGYEELCKETVASHIALGASMSRDTCSQAYSVPLTSWTGHNARQGGTQWQSRRKLRSSKSRM